MRRTRNARGKRVRVGRGRDGEVEGAAGDSYEFEARGENDGDDGVDGDSGRGREWDDAVRVLWLGIIEDRRWVWIC